MKLTEAAVLEIECIIVKFLKQLRKKKAERRVTVTSRETQQNQSSEPQIVMYRVYDKPQQVSLRDIRVNPPCQLELERCQLTNTNKAVRH